jgi:hypothetical protein
MKQHGSDVCYCGDYRSQHNENGHCFVCGDSRTCPCEGYKFSRHASAEEREHWQKYHGAFIVKNPAAVALGKLGGASKSAAKQAASRKNGAEHKPARLTNS